MGSSREYERTSATGRAVKLYDCYFLVKRAAKYVGSPLLAPNGVIQVTTNSAPMLPVSVELKSRALAFLDMHFKRLEREEDGLGWRGAIQGEMDGGVMRLSVVEEIIRSERLPTPDEVARDNNTPRT